MRKTLLLVGSFKPTALERIFEKNLKRCGYDIHRFDLLKYKKNQKSIYNRVKRKLVGSFYNIKLNKSFIQQVELLKPQVILVFRGSNLFPETLAAIKDIPEVLINFNPDHPYFFPNPNLKESINIKDSIGHYHLYIHYAQTVVDTLKSDYGVDSLRIPFGFDEDAIISDHGEQDLNEIIFAGAWDKEREEILSKVAENFTLKIYGDQDWKIKTVLNKNIRNCFTNEMLQPDKYQIVAREAQGMINLLREQNLREGSHNMRTFEVTGFGGVLITQRTKEQEEFFKENEEVLFFDDSEELYDKIAFLKKNPSKIISLKQNALERSKKSQYDYYHRVKILDDYLNKLL